MKPLDAALLERIDRYVEDLFAVADAALVENVASADAAGLPPIQVSATEGKLLYIIARLVQARRVLEIGTLAGYSTTWLARALPQGGSVVSLEIDPQHASVARKNLDGVAPGVSIEVREGDAAATLAAMRQSGEQPFDLVFIDADKRRYVEYLELALNLSRPGTVILADNLIRHGAVLDAEGGDENALGARRFNAHIAAHARLESIVLPILREKIDGLSISIVK